MTPFKIVGGQSWRSKRKEPPGESKYEEEKECNSDAEGNADGPLLASSPRRKSSGVSKAIAIWALSFTRLQANRNLLAA